MTEYGRESTRSRYVHPSFYVFVLSNTVLTGMSRWYCALHGSVRSFGRKMMDLASKAGGQGGSSSSGWKLAGLPSRRNDARGSRRGYEVYVIFRLSLSGSELLVIASSCPRRDARRFARLTTTTTTTISPPTPAPTCPSNRVSLCRIKDQEHQSKQSFYFLLSKPALQE